MKTQKTLKAFKFKATKRVSRIVSGTLRVFADSKDEALMIVSELTNSEMNARIEFNDLDTDYDSFSGLTIYDGDDIISQP